MKEKLYNETKVHFMRTLIHISDLHFGKTELALERALRQFILARKPDLVVVSGDLTQRATASQFREAEKFFASLPFPLLIVPGNHDVPTYSFWRRFYRPYANYKRYISEDLEPEYQDEEVAVVGINTVRTFKMKEGRINEKQARRAEALLRPLPPEMIKVVVSHHPFNIPERHYKRPLSQVRRFWKELQEAGIDLMLSGHLHDTLTRYRDTAFKLKTEGPLMVYAGTAISTLQRRKEGNAFNVIQLDRRRIHIERYVCEKGKATFVEAHRENFLKEGKVWKRVNT